MNVFGMKVFFYDLYLNEERVKEVGGKFVDFEMFLKESDVVMFYVLLVDVIYYFINEERFKFMKLIVIFINVVRGVVVDIDVFVKVF